MLSSALSTTWLVAFAIVAVCFAAALINWRITKRKRRNMVYEQRMLRNGITTILVVGGILGAAIYVGTVEKPRGVPVQKRSFPTVTN